MNLPVRGSRILALLMACGAHAVAWPADSAASVRAAPADLTGIWRIVEAPAPANASPTVAGPPPSVRAALPRFRPEVAARVMNGMRGGPPADRGYCTPVAFTGPVGYGVAPPALLPVNIEILASPGRLTILDEMGMIRRLYLRSTPPPDALDESNAGTSIARWDGAQLVVATTGLNPAAKVILGIPGTELGRNARIEERFSLVGPDLLQIVTTVTAPDLYAMPVTTTNRYRREAGATMLEVSVCTPDDRSYDQATGNERFDARPPAGLPPPPLR
jgi:hypothetical protein